MKSLLLTAILFAFTPSYYGFVNRNLELRSKRSKSNGRCLKNWSLLDNTCYLFAGDKVNWNSARSNCESFGRNSRLVEINNSKEDEFITSSFSSLESAWIGLENVNGEFKWTVGTSLGYYNNWRVNQPDNHLGKELCVHIHKYPEDLMKQWNDLSCAKKLQYVCQMDALQPINGAWNEWTADGSCSKTCGEGEQMFRRTCDNPKPQHGGDDCEGDSEKTIECKNCPCGWKQFQSSCYKAFHDVAKSYQDAAEYCSVKDAQLMTVRSSQEHNFVINNLELKMDRYWIGLTTDESGSEPRHWKWIDGNAAAFTNWYKNEPNNYNNDEYCAHYYNSIHNYKWNDWFCYKAEAFICQIML